MRPAELSQARVAVAPGVSIAYLERGVDEGVPIVLIHGLGDSLRSFEPVLAHLPDGVHTLVPSLRGHGDSGRPEHGYAPADHVEDLRVLLDAAGVDQTVIGGHSSGSQVALLFALTYPQRTRGVVLIGAPGPHPDRVAAEMMSADIAALEDPIDEAWLREFALSTVSGPVPESFLNMIVAESRKVPARVYQASWPGIRDFDVSTDLRKITAPTLIVWGDQDRVPVSTRSAQDRLADAMREARLVVYEGAGHSPHWEHPQRFAADLEAFLRSRPT